GTDLVGADGGTHARGHAALGPGEEPRGDGGEIDDDEGEQPHEGQVDELRPWPARRVLAPSADQAVDPSLHRPNDSTRPPSGRSPAPPRRARRSAPPGPRSSARATARR